MKIVRKLEEWHKAGLLEASQAASIARYEEEHSGATQWVVWGVGAVGAFAIVTGIVSVIAANWDGIPAWLKLLAAVALMLATLAGAAWTSAPRFTSTWPRDIFLLLHAGLTLATVGLIAQVYHLHGHPWRAPALCAVLALPAAFVSRRGLLSHVVLGFVSVSAWLFSDEMGWLDGDALVVRLLAAAFGLLLLAGARLLVARREDPAGALQGWGFAILTVLAIHACAVWSSDRSSYRHDHGLAVAASAVLFALSVVVHVGLELLTPATGRMKRLLAVALFVVLLIGGALLSATNAGDGSTGLLRQLVGFAIACALCIAVAVAAAHGGSQRGTNLATLALALRILFLYGELARDLMTTGAGLILTGLVILGLAYGWWRLRRVLPVAEPGPPGAPSADVRGSDGGAA